MPYLTSGLDMKSLCSHFDGASSNVFVCTHAWVI